MWPPHGINSLYQFLPFQSHTSFMHLVQCVSPSHIGRRDALRFLKAIDPEKFADGLRQALGDDEISMCFWLSTGFPPQLRLKGLRAKDRGQLNLGFRGQCSVIWLNWRWTWGWLQVVCSVGFCIWKPFWYVKGKGANQPNNVLCQSCQGESKKAMGVPLAWLAAAELWLTCLILEMTWCICTIGQIAAEGLMGPAKLCSLPRKEKFVENAQRLSERQGGRSRLMEVLPDYSNLEAQ